MMRKDFTVQKEKGMRSEHYHVIIMDMHDARKARVISENVSKLKSSAIVSIPTYMEVREIDLYKDRDGLRMEGKIHKNGKTTHIPALNLRKGHEEYNHGKEVWQNAKIEGETTLYALGLKKMAFM